MTGKHYNWHRRWILDPAAQAATHDTGWVVRFVTEAQYADMPLPDIGGQCVTNDGAVWLVLHQGGDAALKRWLEAQAENGLRDTGSVQRRIARLMREAGELWVHYKNREGKQ